MSSALTTPAQATQVACAIQHEVGRVFVGQQAVVQHTLGALLAGGHVLLEGVPGLGKTLLVKALARTFGGKFSRIQFTPDLMPADVTGHTLFDTRTSEFVMRFGPVFANLLLADEINRAPAKTQSALLEVMQEAQVTIEGKSHKLLPPFLVLATQNPIEQDGTYALPEAQLDRFLVKINIDYPSQVEEEVLIAANISGRVNDRLMVDAVQQVLTPDDLIAMQTITASVKVDQAIVTYVTKIVRATRNWPGIAVGSGPRGGIALIRLGRAMAILAGRDYVTPDDIKHIAPAILRHRISLTPDAEIEGLTVDGILSNLLAQTDAPRS